MPYAPLADLQNAALVVIDVQEKLAPHIAEHAGVCSTIVKLIRAARVLALPVVWTEQNPRGLGATLAPIRESMPPGAQALSKETFSCWGDVAFREQLQRTMREHIVVVGIEAHVCVQQTVLDLLRVDYTVFVPADGIGSRRVLDRDVSLSRMAGAGALVTTAEAVIMELQQRFTTPTFKAVLDIIK
jgi:nicotinamidase-related amidase